jgi:hypothetical protein
MLLGVGTIASAHSADISHLRVKLEPQRVEFRFSLNVATLARILVVDADQNDTVTLAELDQAAPVVSEFLRKHVLVSINDQETDLGTFRSHECIWPNPGQNPVTRPEAGQRFVDFTLVKEWPGGVQDVWVGFQWFEQLGNLHNLSATFAQAGEHDTPVDFTVAEPEYLYDTGWEVPAPTPPSTRLTTAHWPEVGLLAATICGLIIALHRRRR